MKPPPLISDRNQRQEGLVRPAAPARHFLGPRGSPSPLLNQPRTAHLALLVGNISPPVHTKVPGRSQPSSSTSLGKTEAPSSCRRKSPSSRPFRRPAPAAAPSRVEAGPPRPSMWRSRDDRRVLVAPNVKFGAPSFIAQLDTLVSRMMRQRREAAMIHPEPKRILS